MADLNPQPLPPRAISLEEAVEAITRGVLRAMEARGGHPGGGQAHTASLTLNNLPFRIIAGGILEPALEGLGGLGEKQVLG